MKNFSMFLILLIFVACSACNNSKSIELYVSAEGNNSAIGNQAEPLATLPAAVQKVRSLRQEGNTSPATIYLREGRHQINKTLVLAIEDGRNSGNNNVEPDKYGAGESKETPYLSITAYQGESPVLSAGVQVKDWRLASEEVTELPEVALGKVWVADIPENLGRFYTLYDSKGRLKRARSKGFVPTKTGDKRTLYFPEGALKDWDNLEDVEINIRPVRAWMINMLPLEEVDEENNVARTGVSATYDLGKLPAWVHTKDGTQGWVENVIEALDEPGEWVVNTKTRKIYLWPANPAKDGSPQGVLAPSTSELIRVEGGINYDGPEDKPVKGIAISGITFTHADRWAWTNDESRLGWGMQHDWDLFDRPTALLRFRGAEDCSVSDCKFLNSGGTGIRFDLHAQRNRIENCEFAYLGEAGIILNGYGTGTKDVNHHNDIINNHIHHFSEITWHSPGIWAWQSGHNHIAHNYVHHSGYSAVLITNRVEPDRSINGEGGRTIRHAEIPQSVIDNTKETYESWLEREKYIHARHNLFEYNEISHTVQLLSDGNGIYISGAGTGNIIRYNYIHDNLEHSFPSCIRCDDDQHETLIYGNVLYNNYGFGAGIVSKGRNDIVNNFIVAPKTKPTWGYISFEWVRVDDSKSQRNIIISHPDGGKAQGERLYPRTEDGDPNMEETDMDSNLYYHPSNTKWVDKHLARLRKVGNEKNSLFADPMFTDPANGDFSFKEGSPALKLGIEKLDVSKMGLIDKNINPKLPVTSRLVLDLNADRGLTIEEDSMVTKWTNQAPEAKAVDFITTEEGRTKTIISQSEPGTGRPTLLENISEINEHNSLVFREDELINENDEAFHGMMTGSGYTWFALIKPYEQLGPGKINSRYPNAFFGCLRNSGPPQKETGQYAGFWGSFYPDGRIYMGSRNGLNEKVRDGINTPEVEGPAPAVNEWHIIMGRQGSGKGVVQLELFVDNPSEAVNFSDFPVGDVEPRRMAIGTERNAINHQGKESFDGELARLLMYDTALNQQEMKEVYGYLKAVYFE